MTIEACALAAVKAFPDRELAISMVAIAGAETNWTDEPGDAVQSFPQADRAEYLPWSCDGFTSWGQWQINYRWNHDVVSQLAGITEPCMVKNWLLEPDNCALAAKAVYDRQGPGAWSTYNQGLHLQHIDAATQAVDAALAVPLTPDNAGRGAIEDLINLLGYIQGDVATAITDPVTTLVHRYNIPDTDDDLQALYAACTTLRTAGK